MVLTVSVVACFWHLGQFGRCLVESHRSIGQPEVERTASGATAKAAVGTFRRVDAEDGIIVTVSIGRLAAASG